MGALEIILIVCMVLKFAGVAFATTGYLAMLGYYVGAFALLFVIILAGMGTIRLLSK